jgi:hypothetical protein
LIVIVLFKVGHLRPPKIRGLFYQKPSVFQSFSTASTPPFAANLEWSIFVLA